MERHLQAAQNSTATRASSSIDRASNELGPLPDLYQLSSSVSIGFLILAAVIVLFMQLG